MVFEKNFDAKLLDEIKVSCIRSLKKIMQLIMLNLYMYGKNLV